MRSSNKDHGSATGDPESTTRMDFAKEEVDENYIVRICIWGEIFFFLVSLLPIAEL